MRLTLKLASAMMRARIGRSPAAAPMFALDRQRLTPYSDEAGLFDNRYFAELPSHEALQEAGIRHLLYLTPDAQVTLDADDLDGDLVALDQRGVDVKMLALSDLSETPLPGWLDDPAPPTCPPAPTPGAVPARRRAAVPVGRGAARPAADRAARLLVRDRNYHGVAADPFFRYSIRVNGVFRPESLARREGDLGDIQIQPFAGARDRLSVTAHLVLGDESWLDWF